MQVTIEIEYDQIFDLARQLKPWERKQLIRELETDAKESDGKSSTNDPDSSSSWTRTPSYTACNGGRT